MSRFAQNPATSDQTTPAQHLRNLRELANKVEHALQYTEIDFSPQNIEKLLTESLYFAAAARSIAAEMGAIKPEKSPDHIPALDFDFKEVISLHSEKITALVDVLITANQAGSDLFEGTAGTLLCSIIDYAKAIDTAVVKISQEG